MGVNHKVFLALIDDLQRGPRPKMDDPTHRNDVSLWRLSQIHRETAGEDNERLFLVCMHVTPAARSGLVPPHVRAGVIEADQALKLR